MLYDLLLPLADNVSVLNVFAILLFAQGGLS